MNAMNIPYLVQTLRDLADRIESGECMVNDAESNVEYGVKVIDDGSRIVRKVPNGLMKGVLRVEYKGFRSMK